MSRKVELQRGATKGSMARDLSNLEMAMSSFVMVLQIILSRASKVPERPKAWMRRKDRKWMSLAMAEYDGAIDAILSIVAGFPLIAQRMVDTEIARGNYRFKDFMTERTQRLVKEAENAGRANQENGHGEVDGKKPLGSHPEQGIKRKAKR